MAQSRDSYRGHGLQRVERDETEANWKALRHTSITNEHNYTLVIVRNEYAPDDRYHIAVCGYSKSQESGKSKYSQQILAQPVMSLGWVSGLVLVLAFGFSLVFFRYSQQRPTVRPHSQAEIEDAAKKEKPVLLPSDI